MAMFQPTSTSQAIGLAKLLEAKLTDVPSATRHPLLVAPKLYVSIVMSPSLRATVAARSSYSYYLRRSSLMLRHLLLFRDISPSDLAPPPPLPTSLLPADFGPPSELFQLSVDALSGCSSPHTLRLCGSICGLPVTILVDNGGVNCIFSFAVMVGNNEALHCSGFCLAVSLVLQGHSFTIPLYMLTIHCADLVLGVQWLRSLGPFLFDFLLCRLVAIDIVASAYTISVRPLDSLSLTADDLTHLSNCPADLFHILHEYAVVFSRISSLRPPRTHDHHIHLQLHSAPINVRPYRYPHCQKDAMTSLIYETLREGLIRPSTNSFSSPVLLVKRKDGSWRFYVDYRALNAVTVRDPFPIPTVDELLNELTDSSYFSKMDLRSGYHQIRIAEADIHKTAFHTVDEHFEFVVMLFGLTNASSTFQAAMNDLLRPFLHCWAANRLVEVQFFCLDRAAAQAFQALKDAMTLLPVLALPDFSIPFDLTTYASTVAIGAVLSQQGHPIAFYSKKMCSRMR
ncbi:UNVERIFIED_CONTAM: Transposon Ty3-G Gag-Pol polyprotein [Sesamum latifolium]|uniref:Transposon Ty3-G Gag-Pol polyprotein n=1 Tax=Sesamum latifolium TaxID=2727402 RepID=A0AAW2Y8T2_9LAMI